MKKDPASLIKEALPEIEALMANAYKEAEPLKPDHPLAQVSWGRTKLTG